MKLLLTSQGLFNDSIKKAFLDLVAKDPKELNAVFVPTASTGIDGDKSWMIADLSRTNNLHFKSLDVVDITALSKKDWTKRIDKADVLFVGGGDPFYLHEWAKKTGFDKFILKFIEKKFFVGNSSGAMLICNSIPAKSKDFYEAQTKVKKDLKGLRLVDFTLIPHYLTNDFLKVTKAAVQDLAKEINDTIYAIDDNTAIKIDGDKIEIISEGKWEKFN